MRAIPRDLYWYPRVDYTEARVEEESAGGLVTTASRGYFRSGEEPLRGAVNARLASDQSRVRTGRSFEAFRRDRVHTQENPHGRQVKVELNTSELLHALVRELTAARCLVRQLDGTSCRVVVLDTRGAKDDLTALRFFVSVWASGRPGAVATVTADGL